MKKENKKKNSKGRIISTVVLIAALAVFIYAAWNLYSIYHNYKSAENVYQDLNDSYVTSNETDPDMESTAETEANPEVTGYLSEENALIEDAPVPLSVDFDSLKKVNEDLVGWIYVEAVPEVSFPVVEGTDNDHYLHYTFDGQELSSGTVFVSCDNARDFSDVHTVVYGHHMHDGSMFFKLDELRDASVSTADPYFWIMTPEGNYRYHIFSIAEVDPTGEAYQLYSGYGPEFLEWEQSMKDQSLIDFRDVPLSQYDHCVMLSTCTFDSSVRMVILGKCVSSERPADPS